MGKNRAIDDHQIHSLETGWTDAILICRKCSKKLDGGFGIDEDDTLKQALRAALRATGQRGQVGLIEVGCLGVCPKRAVTTLRASQPGQMVIIPKGSQVEHLLQTPAAGFSIADALIPG